MRRERPEVEQDKLEREVGLRLRAVMAEFQIKTFAEMAEVCGPRATVSMVNNWLLNNRANLPRVPQMTCLCERTGLTLDWIYRGVTGSVDPVLAIRLNKRVAEMSR